MAWVQRHRWWVRGVLLVAIVALLSVDGVVIGHRRHVEAVGAAAHRRQVAEQRAAAARVAYARSLTATLTAAYRTIQPMQNDLDLRGTHPNASIDYPVRDALAHTTAAAALKKEIAAVTALPAPQGLQRAGADVRTSLQALTTLTQSFAAHAGDENDTLADDLDAGVFGQLQTDESDLADAVDEVYLPTGVLEPPVAGPGGGTSPVALAPSHDSWLLATDSACNDGELALATLPASVTTTAELRSALTQEISGGTLVSRELAAAKLPAHDTAAAAIRGQLPLFDKLLSYEQQGLSDNEAGALSSSAAALDEGLALGPDLDALGRAFAKYGAASCASLFGGGSSSSGSGSSGSGGPTAAA